MTKFTIEDLRDIAYRGSYDDLERELALQLLSSIEQAPVYLRPFGDDGETFVACDGNDERAITLYAAPQLPQPAAVSVPAAMEMDDDFDSSFEHGKAVGWNAYRAAMLQSFGNSEQLDEVGSWNNHMNTPTAQAGNSPVIGIDMASEPDRSVEVRYTVPPGYVMVPKEMTDAIGEAIAMQANCCGGIALDIYDAMLAAAPQQEVK